MKSTYSKYVFIAAMSLLAACSAEDTDTLGNAIHEPVVLNASVAGAQMSSRVYDNLGNTSDGENAKWGTDLLIALAFSDQKNLTSKTAINEKVKKYKVKENANPAAIEPFDAANTHYWSSKTKTHYVCGWCTKYYSDKSQVNYSATIPGASNVATNQSSSSLIDYKDFLFAPVQAIKYPTESSPAVIKFYHQKTMMEIRFNFEGTSYSLSNMNACQLIDVYSSGNWAYPATGNYGTYTPTGSLATIKFFKDTEAFRAIMIPQNIGGKKITFTTNISNNETIDFTFPEDYELKAGSYYILTFNFSQDKVLSLKTQITNWVAAPVITGNLNL